MKSMNIAASSELVSRLSTHRGVVALDSTDFTDVAAVVMTVADSRSGILALLKRTGFHLPVFILTEEKLICPQARRRSLAEMHRSGWSWSQPLFCMRKAFCRHFTTR